MKLTLLIILLGTFLTIISLKDDSKEFTYVIDSMGFLVKWSSNSDYIYDCHDESVENTQGGDSPPLKPSQIAQLTDKALKKCMIDGSLGTPLRVGKALSETAFIPVRLTLPYELAKKALESKEKVRCSDYVKPLLLACPTLLEPYTQRVQGLEVEE